MQAWILCKGGSKSSITVIIEEDGWACAYVVAIALLIWLWIRTLRILASPLKGAFYMLFAESIQVFAMLVFGKVISHDSCDRREL